MSRDPLALRVPNFEVVPEAQAIPCDAIWRELHHAACAPYRHAGRFAWHFARGKLGRDPVFRELIERGLLHAGTRVLDIGCGQGLLAGLLRAADRLDAAGRWPAAWAAAPAATDYTGIELMAHDVARAEAARQADAEPTRAVGRFACADLRDVALPACDAVVILDVLHYVDHADQERVLRSAAAALALGGRLVLRVGDASRLGRSALSRWVDRLVVLARRRRMTALWSRSHDEWIALLARLGFTVQSVPMSRGTPFANVLLVARRAEAAR